MQFCYVVLLLVGSLTTHANPRYFHQNKLRPQRFTKRPIALKTAHVASESSEFVCVPAASGGFQPKRVLEEGEKTNQYPPLGRKGVSKEECETAVANARNGIVCSHTLLGWKPTHFSGFVETRAGLGKENHGFYGVSIEGPKALETCIKATQFSTSEKVCFWNGDGWMVGLVSGKRGTGGNKYKNLDSCLDSIQGQFRTVGLFSSDHWKLSSCQQCHDSTKYPIPDWAMNEKSFDEKLKNPKTSEQARAWLAKLNNHLHVLKDMPPSVAQRKKMETSSEGKAFLRFIKNRNQALNPSIPEMPASQESSDVHPTKEIQILPSKKLESYRSALPKISDPELDKVLRDENTFFYDEASLPSGYQDASKSVVGVRKSGDSTFVKGAPFMDPQSKKLKVFSHGVGIDPNSSVQTFHFIKRPQKADGSFEKIKVKKTQGSDYREDGETWHWEFPVGTVSGEVIAEKDSQGKIHVLEVRTRKKIAAGKSGWESNIFRPFVSEEDLLTALQELHRDPELGKEAQEVVKALKQTPLESIKIDNGGYRVSGLSFEGHTQVLPELSEKLTVNLLNRTFQSSLGAIWKQLGNQEAFAAASNQRFSVVPEKSKTGAIRVDTESCNSCHQYTNTPLGYLYPGRSGQLDTLLRNTTDAYGNTGGNDGQFRWHPFDPSLMGKFSQVPDNRRVRPEFKTWLEFEK